MTPSPDHSDTSATQRPVSFRRLMALEKLDDDTYRSTTPAWPPGNGTTAFGGHVYAQAALAASKTVAKGMHLHNITGHFILPGRIDTPFTYRVWRIRNGGSYALRQVSVYQHISASAPIPSRFARLQPNTIDPNTPCFVATMSFKRSEAKPTSKRRPSSPPPPSRYIPFAHQSVPKSHLHDTYSSVLRGKKPEDHPVAPGADALWWDGKYGAEWSTAGDKFPGVDTRKVDMLAYNGRVREGGEGRVGQWRQLMYYRIVLDEEEDNDRDEEEDDDNNDNKGAKERMQQDDEDDETVNLHISAHLYASDRNSLFLIQRAHGYQDRQTSMASLSHTVVFHGGAHRLRMVDADSRPKWFVQEAWTSNSGDNRGCHESRLWDWEAGEVLGSTMQDGMLRVSRTNLEEGMQENRRGRRAQWMEMEADIHKTRDGKKTWKGNL